MKQIAVVVLIIIAYFLVAELLCYLYEGKSLPMHKNKLRKSEELLVEGKEDITVILAFRPTEYGGYLVNEKHGHHHHDHCQPSCQPQKEDYVRVELIEVKTGPHTHAWALKISWDVSKQRKLIWEAKNYSG